MHAVHQPLTIDTVDVPEPRPTDVLVEVRACGIVPNLGNVLNHLGEWYPDLFLPPLPAVFGLDPAGVVVAKGDQVYGIDIGTRVYVNPGRYCGGCADCRSGNGIACDSYTFNGYFGFGPGSAALFEDYPYGGLAEYMTAPVYSLVTLPDSVPFETAARFGYLGTGYRALKRAGAGPRTAVLVNGASGTLGLGVVLLALTMGAPRILAVGRDETLLRQVKAICPERIEVFSTRGGGSVAEWARSRTDDRGAGVVIDALGPGTRADALLDAYAAMRRGGQHVNIGAVLGDVPLNLNNLMIGDQRVTGSNWFTTGDGQELADMADSGALDLSFFEHEVFRLEEINDALALFKNRNGGFSNYVVAP
ncbi:alcohol dehydrogenase catalytic domain-containing protein [Streptomyces sp. NPDC059255]|uniref:alcohol dehydrogenase catalytic domain-containing protein n=1 Tax=Streptomyces sp. NPDC059255 TaxID=3346793 RepID=UPI003681DBD8